MSRRTAGSDPSSGPYSVKRASGISLWTSAAISTKASGRLRGCSRARNSTCGSRGCRGAGSGGPGSMPLGRIRSGGPSGPSTRATSPRSCSVSTQQARARRSNGRYSRSNSRTGSAVRGSTMPCVCATQGTRRRAATARADRETRSRPACTCTTSAPPMARHRSRTRRGCSRPMKPRPGSSVRAGRERSRTVPMRSGARPLPRHSDISATS